MPEQTIYITVRNKSGNRRIIGKFDYVSPECEHLYYLALNKGMAVAMYGVWKHDHPYAGRYLIQSRAHREIENNICFS